MTLPRVLIADDDKAVLSGIRRMIEPVCEVVGMVENGQALLGAAEMLRPDVIVADVSMPVMSGFQAARILFGQQPDARVVFLSVHEDETVAQEALALGASGYVVKRSAVADLIPAIQDALEGRRFLSPALGIAACKDFRGN